MIAVVSPFPPAPSLLQPLPSLSSGSRAVLYDPTNSGRRTGKRSIGYSPPSSLKRVAFPTSSVRLYKSYSWSRNPSAPPAPFPVGVAHKAPPTVSLSFSAAYTQQQHWDLDDLPDLQNVVPFPRALSDGNEDVEMLDETRYSFTCCSQDVAGLVPPPPPLRRLKRRSICSPPSPPPLAGGGKKDDKDGSARKRARKSKRHGAGAWWLSMIHRSILHSLGESEGTASWSLTGENECGNPNGPARMRRNTIEAQDELLIGRIWQKLVDGGGHRATMLGSVEGRTSPARLLSSPPPSSPVSAVLIPSPILASPAPAAALDHRFMSQMGVRSSKPADRSSSPFSACLDPFLDTATSPLHSDSPRYPIPSATPLDPFESYPRTPPPSPELIPRRLLPGLRRMPLPPLTPRSPSPSLRTRPATEMPMTLTMPQLVASLTLAHRERRSSRSRNRGLRSAPVHSSTDPRRTSSPSPSPSQSQSQSFDARDGQRCRSEEVAFVAQGKEYSTPEPKSGTTHSESRGRRCAGGSVRRSPLSRVAYSRSWEADPAS